MKKEIWAIGDKRKAKRYCFKKCNGLFFASILVEKISCFPCGNKECKFTKEEYPKYGKLDDGTIVNLRTLI